MKNTDRRNFRFFWAEFASNLDSVKWIHRGYFLFLTEPFILLSPARVNEITFIMVSYKSKKITCVTWPSLP